MFGFRRKKDRPFSDYHEKRLENPFFKKKSAITDWSGWKVKAIFVLGVIFLLALVWFFFFSAFWRIRQVSVRGLDRMPSEDIRQMLDVELSGRKFLILPKNNLLFFNEEKFAAAIKTKYLFQGVAVHKKMPGGVVIDIREKLLAAVWKEGDKYYYIDNEGFVISEVSPLELTEKKYPLIENQSPFRIAAGKIQVGAGCLAAAAELTRQIAEKSVGVTIQEFIVNQEVNAIRLQTPEGLIIVFDTADDFGKQLERLIALKNQRLKDDFFKKKNIDLRFGDKIYFQ